MKKIFGTDGIRCIINQEPMTAETCLKIAKVTGYLLSRKKKDKQRVIISKDTRLSGYLFEPLLTAGFVSMGMDVVLVGPLPTPALPMLIRSLRADMGVMITASHNTYEYNGLKFFDSEGSKLNRPMENKIENIISSAKTYDKIINLSYESGKALRLDDAQGRYSEYLKSTLNNKTKYKNLKVVLDCANGATYNIAPNLFWELGCEVVVINNLPNGKNINLECGAVNVTALSKKVITEKADIGFAFDGDGDRLIAVDEKGSIIDGDNIIALFAKSFLQLNQLNKTTVVTTVMSNMGLEEFLTKKLGIKLIRTNVGDINVIEKMKKQKYSLGGEQSGHIILGNYLSTGDGILAALKLLEIFYFKKIKASKLFNLFAKYPQKKINIPIKKIMNKKLQGRLSKLTHQYIKTYPELRLLVRESGTEPLIRIFAEGKDKDQVNSISLKLSLEIKRMLND